MMGLTTLVTCALGAGICIGAGLWMCVQGASPLHIGAGTLGLLIGGVVHVACMVSAERREGAGE